MNLNRLKAFVWLGALAMGGFLGWFVYEFWENRLPLSQRVTQERQKEVLESVEQPPPPKEVVIDYKLVEAGYHELNWTGKEAPKPKPKPVVEVEPTERLDVPVSDIIEVLLAVVDTGNEAGSSATIRYKDSTPSAGAPPRRGRQRNNKARNPSNPREGTESIRLRVGDALEKPNDYMRVKAIEEGGVRFVFDDDEERESELVGTLPFPTERSIVVVGTGERALQPNSKTQIPVNYDAPVFVPGSTQLVGTNHFRVGTNDAATFNRDYASILSRDVRFKKHKDPSTGRVTGLTVTDVSKGSIVAQHGVKRGMVIKSINGHRVTSVNSAISYVKKESSTTDTWEVLVEEHGREYTIMYDSPTD